MGDMLEAAILPTLSTFCVQHKMYLDYKGKRPIRRGKKCTWIDKYGNKHDLDFVLERGGTLDFQGKPAAFIETAFRRYTKHSRNKAQEIQGAIEPLAETYNYDGPFKGAILAGVFTEGAIDQLKSIGFNVAYFPYTSVVEAFAEIGIDAFYDESTPDATSQQKVDKWLALSDVQRSRVQQALIENNIVDVRSFMEALHSSASRHVQSIIVLPLHGQLYELSSIDEAVLLLESYGEASAPPRFERYEIQIRFSNGNEIIGKFNDKPSSINFLRANGPSNSN